MEASMTTRWTILAIGTLLSSAAVGLGCGGDDSSVDTGDGGTLPGQDGQVSAEVGPGTNDGANNTVDSESPSEAGASSGGALGKRCIADNDCDGGYKCLIADVAQGASIANGLCTKECSTNADC